MNGQRGYPGGAIVGIGYEPDSQIAAFRASVSSADTYSTEANVLALDAFSVLGRPNVVVAGKFSASGQTATVRVARSFVATDGSEYVKSVGPAITLSGGTVQVASGYWDEYTFDSQGATTLRLIVTAAPSSGTVDFWMGSY